MHIRRKLFSVLVILAMTAAALFGDLYPGRSLIDPDAGRDENNTLTIWYTDSYMDEYIRNAAVV